VGILAEAGVNVIGFVSSRLGIGTAARSTVASLVGAGVPVAIADVQLPDGRSGADLRWQHLFIRDASKLPYAVNLVHVNPAEAAAIRRQFPHWFSGSFTAIVPFYELPTFPEDWIPLLARYDLILAASEHIAGGIRNLCSVPVRHFPIGVEPVRVPERGRAYFGLPEDGCIFVFSFDTDSGLNRKNSLGALRAFMTAFSGDDRAMLVVKVNGMTRHHDLYAAAAALGPDRLKIIEGYLPYEDVLALYAACDVFVSLHRAEGLGLGLLEAMSLGKPVIATGWSGNMDFMDDGTAMLVRYSFTPVVDEQGEYSRLRFHETPCWAEPDIADAAAAMRALYSDVTLRERLGAQAKRAAEERNRRFFSEHPATVIGHAYEAWLRRGSVYAHRSPVPEEQSS